MQNKFNVKDSSLSFILAIAIPNVLAFFLLFIAGSFTDIKTIENTTFYKIMATLLSQVSFALVYFYIIKKNKISFTKSVKVSKVNFKQVFITLLIALVCLFLISPIINVFDSFLINIGVSEQTLPIDLTKIENLLYLIFALGILAPVTEEFLFRGIILSGLENKGEKTAVLISSLMFCIMHLSLHQTLYQFILGVILALVMLCTKNIFMPILVHFVNNTFVLLINYISPSFFDYNFLSLNYIILAVTLFILGLITICILVRMLKKHKPQEKIQSENKMENINVINENNINDKNNLLNVSLIFGFVMWVITVILSL